MKAMHMEQKYQEADNVITFNHLMNFTIGQKEVRAKSSFATAYECCALDWDLQLHKQFSGRSINYRESHWIISLHGSGTRDLYPPIRHLQFTLKALDHQGNTTATLKHFIDGSLFFAQQRHQPSPLRRRLLDQKTYSTEVNSKFGKQMSALMESSRKMVLQLETRIEFLKADFVDSKWLVEDGAVEVGEMKEYFYDALTNKSRHDLKLKTSDGRQFLMTNKEVLCISSSFFRQNLKDHTKEWIVTRADSLESIEIALTFLMTGRFKRPAQMTPRIAKEVYDLTAQWKAFEPKLMKNSIERLCYDELCKNREDFAYVCNLLIMADETQLPSLHNCCIATIAYYHFHDFVRSFVSGNHPLKERFSQRREFMRPSLTMQIKRGFVAANEARSFVKYIPVLGQD